MRRLAGLVLVLSAVAEPPVGRWQLDGQAVALRLAVSLRRQRHQVPAEHADAVTSSIDRITAAEAAKLAGSAVLFDADGRVRFEIAGQRVQDGTWSVDGDVVRLVPNDPTGVALVARSINDELATANWS